MTQNDDQISPPTVPWGIPELDEATVMPVKTNPEVLIITGMSGAGRSRAGQALEDLDWYVVDNLPPQMLVPFARMMTSEGEGVHRLAAVVDVRSRDFFREFVSVLDELKRQGIDHRLVFLDTADEVLVRRYESVRRPHPLQADGRILDGILAEREVLAPLRFRADSIIDTSAMTVHELARHMRSVVSGESERPIRLTVMSFGFKHGLPLDADHVIDMRFLKNPYWVSELRHLRGVDEPVARYVLDQPGAREFAQGYVDLIFPIFEGYLSELKPFVTIAVGCTGGQHRSVAMTEVISQLMRERGLGVRTVHRDMGKE